MARVFVTLDNSQDLSSFSEMKNWKDFEGKDFDLVNSKDLIKKIETEDDEDLKSRLRGEMIKCDVVAVVVGEKTKSFRKATRWQLEIAVELGLPLIVLNKNGIRSVDYERIPAFLKRQLSMHITFQNEIFSYALKEFPASFKQKLSHDDHKTYRYSNEVYDSLGLHTADFA